MKKYRFVLILIFVFVLIVIFEGVRKMEHFMG